MELMIRAVASRVFSLKQHLLDIVKHLHKLPAIFRDHEVVTALPTFRLYTKVGTVAYDFVATTFRAAEITPLIAIDFGRAHVLRFHG